MKKVYHEPSDLSFGMKNGNLDTIKKEPNSSRYLRYLIKTNKLIKHMNKGLLLDVNYDKIQNIHYCKFYDLDAKIVRIWIDNSNYKAYCLSKVQAKNIKNNTPLINFEGLSHYETIKKYDLLNDEEIEMTRLFVKYPNKIGSGKKCVKELMREDTWESNIRSHHSFIYDLGLVPGLIYKVTNGKITKVNHVEKDEKLQETSREFLNAFINDKEELKEFARRNIDVFLTPIPNIDRMALDIETHYSGTFPDVKEAEEEIISISFVSTKGLNLVFMLDREDMEYDEHHKNLPENSKIMFFKTEKELLIETFRVMWEHPIIITFNGDNFDLSYMYFRASKLNIDRDLIPINVSRGYGLMSQYDCEVLHGIHIDLFNFFSNKSIKGYAYGGAYDKNSLESISSALLKEGKYQHEEEIHDMTLPILAWYNLKDSILTLNLTTYNDALTWNLIILLLRITKMPIHDMIRRQIGTWNKSLLFFEHRQRNCLIPRRDHLDALKQGGATQSTSGKEFKGAMVIEPVPGIHYTVVVMDFASLYPSIIKEYNLSYETIMCSHEECKEHALPDLPYYTCTKKMGMATYMVGFFRDIRVKFFKPRSIDKKLTEKERSYYTTIQQALKVFINSAYGVYGDPTFALFCLPVAESVTGVGRYSIKETIKKCESMGIMILYGDTDSVFLKNYTPEQLREIEKWSKETLDLDLEEEKTYQFLALSDRKKNYVGIHEGGKKVDKKGVTAKKKNTPQFIKATFLRIIEILKKVTDDELFNKARGKIISLIKRDKKKIGDPEALTLEDYAINTVLKKNPKEYIKTIPQHVRAAKMDKSRKYFKNDVVTYIKTNGKITAKPLSMAKLHQVNTKVYNTLLKNSLEQLLDAIGINWGEIKGFSQKLSDFF